MKRTFITAILIAITANSASAQQVVSVPYQAVQWPAGSQAYQPQIQYPVQQSYPLPSSPALYMTQGQYHAVPQTVFQPAVPAATTQVLSTPADVPTRVLTQSVVKNRAPAPAPSIPPQPGDLIVPAPAYIVAQPAPSIPPQPRDLIAPTPTSIVAQPVQPGPQKLAVDQQAVPGNLSAPAPSRSEDVIAPVTSSLVAQPEPVRPVEESVLMTRGNQEEFAVVENKESTVGLVKEAVSSPETATAVVENRLEGQPALEGQLSDLTEKLVAVPGSSDEITPVLNDVEESIAPATDIDFANINPTEEPVEEVIKPVELARTELKVTDEAKTESTEPRLLGSALETSTLKSSPLEAGPVEPPVLTAVPLKSTKEASNNEALSSNALNASAPLASTAPKKIQQTTGYGSWWLALLPLLAMPVIGWLAIRKRKQNAEVNSFANEALSRVNTKPSSSEPVAETPGQRKKLSAIARSGSKGSTADSPSPVRSRLDKMVKNIDQKETLAGEGKEPAKSVYNFSNCDQFCCIRGIDSTTQDTLHKAGFIRFVDLEKATQSELEVALSGNDHQFSSSDFSSWSRLSGLAGKGDWAGFETLQASLAAPQGPDVSSEQPIVAPADAGADDLTKVRGIGPATAELLNGGGITTFKALADAGTDRLQKILDTGGAKFDAIDPSLWCRQAQFQLSGTWTRPHLETLELESESVGPNVTVTTPEYRIAVPTVELVVNGDQPPLLTAADSLAKATGVVGALSKEEVERLEQLAGTPSQLNDESALLDQINAIRDLATSSAESRANEESDSAADARKTSAE